MDRICRQATSSWWDRQSAAILTALASSAGPIDSDIIHSLPSAADNSISRDFLSRTSAIDFSANPQAAISKEELFYANQVDVYLGEALNTSQTVYLHQMAKNSAALNKPSLFNYLYNTSNANSVFFDESKHCDLQEVFRLIKRMFTICAVDIDDVGSSETPLLNLTPPVVHERALEARAGSQLQMQFLSRAIVHLEAEYAAYLQTVVAANPRVAQLGGRPGVRALVRAFLNVRNPTPQSSRDAGFEPFSDYEVSFFSIPKFISCGD